MTVRISNLETHVSKSKVRRVCAVLGSGPSAFDMVDMLVAHAAERGLVAAHSWPESMSDVREAFKKQSVFGEKFLYVLHGGLDVLTDADLPSWMHCIRVDKGKEWSPEVVITGEGFSSDDVALAFKRPYSMTYEAGFGTRDTLTGHQYVNMARWVARLGEIPEDLALRVLAQVDTDEAEAHNVAQMCSVLGDVTTLDVAMMVPRSSGTAFVDALIEFDLPRAVEAAAALTPAQARTAQFRVLTALKTMTLVYPAVQKFPAPGREASIQSGVPVETLARYWKSAGRYSPAEVVRRMLLLTKLDQPVTAESLVALTLLW